MKPKPTPGEMRKQILDDHRRIGELISQVAGGPSAAATVKALEELEPLLRRHFREEEDEIDGLHADILTQSPQHANALQDLKTEHRELLDRVQQLLQRARAGGDGDELRELGQQLKGSLVAHETRETEIFVDSIWTDIGAPD